MAETEFIPDAHGCHVLFRDTDLLAVCKPSGVSVLADRTGAPSLWEPLKAFAPTVRPVHRIDKGTSGVLLLALSRSAQKRLNHAFAERAVHKYYLAQCVGRFPEGGTQLIDLPLCKGRKSRYRIAGAREAIRAHPHGFDLPIEAWRNNAHAAVSRVRCLASSSAYSSVLIAPVTGRTHQIRVHLAWTGYPLRGDHLYGRPKDPSQAFPRLALHCHSLVVPTNTGTARFVSAVPAELLSA